MVKLKTLSTSFFSAHSRRNHTILARNLGQKLGLYHFRHAGSQELLGSIIHEQLLIQRGTQLFHFHGEFSEKNQKKLMKNQVKLTNITPLRKFEPPIKNPGSASDKNFSEYRETTRRELAEFIEGKGRFTPEQASPIRAPATIPPNLRLGPTCHRGQEQQIINGGVTFGSVLYIGVGDKVGGGFGEWTGGIHRACTKWFYSFCQPPLLTYKTPKTSQLKSHTLD